MRDTPHTRVVVCINSVSRTRSREQLHAHVHAQQTGQQLLRERTRRPSIYSSLTAFSYSGPSSEFMHTTTRVCGVSHMLPLYFVAFDRAIIMSMRVLLAVGRKVKSASSTLRWRRSHDQQDACVLLGPCLLYNLVLMAHAYTTTVQIATHVQMGRPGCVGARKLCKSTVLRERLAQRMALGQVGRQRAVTWDPPHVPHVLHGGKVDKWWRAMAHLGVEHSHTERPPWPSEMSSQLMSS